MIILLLFAALAGIVTVLSPCILPVLPLLLSASAGGHKRPWGIIVGLIISFTFFTLALSALVHATGISPNFLRYIAIGLIIFFGLTMIFPKLSEYFASFTSGVAILGNKVQKESTTAGTGFFSGVVLGCALGLLWTPCAGPILATITTLVATQAITWSTVIITFAYSLGAALPMFIIMYGGKAILNSTQFLSKYSELIRKGFGVLMIMSALAIAFHGDVILQRFAANYFPKISIENNERIKKELAKLNFMPNPNFSFSVNPKAPEIIGITHWINSEPLTLEQLRGKVVLVDFWTYSCINCVRTLPYIKKWYDKYKDNNFVIIGVHTPEFEFEKDIHNVQDAVNRFEIKYPVAMDNEYKTWQNYNNRYWPAHYLIDQNGMVKEHHFGEGAYEETENAIRSLLGLTPIIEKAVHEPIMAITPETYLGYRRAQAYHPEFSLKKDQIADYDYKGTLSQNQVGLKGSWLAEPESIQAKSDNALLELNFTANRVYLVMKSSTPQLVSVLLDGNPVSSNYHTVDMNEQGQILVKDARMYDILDLKGDGGRHILTLQFPKDVSPYVFTFGSGTK